MKGKRLIALIGLVVLLAGIVTAFVLLRQGGAPAEETITDGPGTIRLVSLMNSTVKSMEYTFDGETVKLVREGDDFRAEGNPDFVLDRQKILYMLVFACNAEAVAEVNTDGMEDFSPFGFDKSPLTIRLTLEDGSVISEEYGAFNQYTGTYYFRTSQKEGVYLADNTLLGYFSYHLNELASLPEDWSDFNLYTTLQFAVRSEDNSYEFQSYSGGNPDFYDSSSDNYFWFAGYPYTIERACDTSPVQNLLKQILDLAPDVGVDYNPTAAELADYSLDEPRSVIHVYYFVSPETAFTQDVTEDTEQDVRYYDYALSLGRTVGSYTCVMLNIDLVNTETGERETYLNDGIVYGILTEKLQPILTFEVSSALTKDLCKLTAESVDKIAVTFADGTKAESVIDHENVTDAQKDFFALLNAIAADDRTSVDPDGTEPALTIEFFRSSEKFSRMVMTFTEYGTQYYRAEFAGLNELLINKRDVEQLIRLINAL